MVFTFLENALDLGIFTHAHVLHSELQAELKICFPQPQKGVEKAMIYFIKIQSQIMKMDWNIRLFIFSMICNFSKCDDFTVL